MSKPAPKVPKGIKSIPTQVQLAGGVVLKAMPFKIISYNADGTPRTFELQPHGQPHDMAAEGACVLFAQESWIRKPQAVKEP